MVSEGSTQNGAFVQCSRAEQGSSRRIHVLVLSAHLEQWHTNYAAAKVVHRPFRQ